MTGIDLERSVDLRRGQDGLVGGPAQQVDLLEAAFHPGSEQLLLNLFKTSHF